MESEVKEEVAGSIPHMRLFMYLKRKFPSLKDADVTDAIQRFGLDKIRCEDELNRKNEENHKGYNSPWNRSRASSRGSPSSRNSPLSPSDTHSYSSSPLQNGSSPSTPVPSQPQFCLNQRFNLSEKENFDSQINNSTPPASESKGTYSFAAPMKDSSTTSEESHWKHSSPQVADSGCGRSLNECKYLEEETSATQTIPESRTLYPEQSSSEPRLLDERPAHLFNLSPSHNMNPSTTNSASISPTNANAISPSVNGQNAQKSHQFPAAIQEQLARKQRLKEELSRRMGEKMKLEVEVKNLVDELETKESSQRLDVIKSKKEIELIQQENGKLQFICDEMEREILESGESPKTDQEGRARGPPLRLPSSPNEYPCTPTPTHEAPHRIPPQQPLPQANPAASLNSGGIGSPTTPVLPTRRAPSPPSMSIPTSINRNFEQVQRPTTIGSDESRKEWACSKCTFINSPYLNECEICGFQHFSVGTPPHLPPSQSHPPNPGGPCYCHHRRHHSQSENRNAGELQDIHIQVRHQNYP